MKFSEFGLSDQVLRAVTEAGYEIPTPIQELAIPYVQMGRDVLACAQTGTGKTASFTLPMIDVLAAGRAKARLPRSLIIEPTRELAAQVAEHFEVHGKYHKLTMALLIGGVSMGDQIKVVDRGVDVLIATPGRLLDMFERGGLMLTDVKILVIDEADRMLDMGFIPDVERIVSLMPKIRQTLFFSATMPKEIRRLADAFLMNPKEISVAPPATPAATVTQGLVMVKTPPGVRPGGAQKEKRDALRDLIRQENVKNALVFCNRKRDVGVVHRSLSRHGFSVGQLHGDMQQSLRTETLENFRNGMMSILVCSDVAARGLDIVNMSHVFNFDVPSHAEDYVHRIGRTGRAGRAGRAFTFATGEDTRYLAAITKLIGMKIPLTTIGAAPAAEPAPEAREETPEPPARIPEKPAPERERKRRGKAGPAAPAKKPAERPAERPAQRKEQRPAERKEQRPRREPDKPIVGLGEHTPAFLLRSVKLSEK